jgi:hypothetical protein
MHSCVVVGIALSLISPRVINLFPPAPWSQYGGNAQHTALSKYASVSPTSILWQAPVDLHPQYSGNDLLIHYGSPMITRLGTVVTSVKTGTSDNFEFRAYYPNGAPFWTVTTDYTLPPHGWTPSCAGAFVLGSSYVAFPASGGRVLFRSGVDFANASLVKNAFYGNANYAADPATYDANVKICSPMMSSNDGHVFFGFRALGNTPLGLQSGIARQYPWTSGNWVSASAASGDPNMVGTVMNCTPALSNDGQFVYVAVSSGDFGYGYLLCLNSQTLATVSKVRLKDPNGNDALLPDAGTASPMVGPDGDVYFGVLENPFPYNHDRGWMLHFDAKLQMSKPTGAFGWDDTASVVPSYAVPSYTGSSAYLILTKYNNYAGVGGTGVNNVGILDPNATQIDSITGNTVMREILVRPGITPDQQFIGSHPNAVREWCINSAAIDPFSWCAIVNSEDGRCYRWDFRTNTLDRTVVLTSGVGEAYTPTAIGPNGVSYAINNAILFAMGGAARRIP